MGAPLRVLFAGMRYDYGDASRGASFEHQNFFSTLEAMDDVDVASFDFKTVHQQGGQAAVAAGLRQAVADHRPDLVFFVLFEDEFPTDVLAELRDRTDLVTYNWFCDDHWRFDGFSSRYAPLFDAISTTDLGSLAKYEAIGITAIKTQWACNPTLYAPTGGPIRPGVTFVGQGYGARPWTVKQIAKAGVPIQAYGPGFANGRLAFDDMVDTFATSEISLNLTAASRDPSVPHVLQAIVNRTYPPAMRWLARGTDQIKGRTFEIPGCGGFQLSSRVADIESYLEPGVEIVIYDSLPELVEQAQRYLADRPARDAVAAAGLKRTLAEHTYEHRFRAIFAELGLG